MSESNQLSRPLGNNIPLPGGDPMAAQGPTQAPAQPPPSGGVGDMPSPAMSFDGSRRTLMQEHMRNKAAYEATSKALKQLDVIRKGLSKLADKQDIVTLDDVVEEAGKLVSHGIDPVSLAGILAEAPQEGGGEALGGWVASHAQTAMQAEQQMIQQHNLIQHQMGVSAVHLLMAHANAQHMLGGMSPPMGGGNELGAQTPADESPGNSLMRPQ
jgi:hypothetical protein